MMSDITPSAGQAITKKLKSSKKSRSNLSVECVQVCTYSGHRDGVWQFSHVRNGLSVIGSASAVRERVEKLELLMNERSTEVPSDPLTPLSTGEPHSFTTTPSRKIKIKNSGQAITKKLKSSKKNRSNLSVECVQVCTYSGHRDGVWQVSHARNGLPVIGSASADNTASVWDVDTGNSLMKYVGHSGSVNSIAFHPTEHYACTTSGDTTAHVWRCTMNPASLQRQWSSSNSAAEKTQSKQDSSGEDRNISDEDQTDTVEMSVMKTPVMVLRAHKAPVMSCDWLVEGQQLVTASWDHTAKLWDFESGQVIHSLEGHDLELTHVCTHPTQQLVVTSSQDTTFRLWDFRAPPIHSVNVFQGHSKSKAVNSAVFSMKENVISGSDDHTVKIWDLRNMRSPLDSLRVDCGINRLSVSHDDRHALAVPLDNSHIKLYDLAGNRLAHLPRRGGQGHHRMVYSVAWSPDGHQTTERCNLFSAGFDNKVIGWKVTF